PTVLRTGGLKVEDIERLIGLVAVNAISTSNPQAPGQLHSHYAPRKPLIIGDVMQLMKDYGDRSLGTLTFRESTSAPVSVVLSEAGDRDEAARTLFAALRTLDSSDADLLLAEYVPDTGLGRAINDRLRRAGSG